MRDWLMPDSKHDERLSAEIPRKNMYYTILHQHFRLNEEHRGDGRRDGGII